MPVNNDFQKNSNLSQILNTIWNSNLNHREISRIDIAKELNIYRSTVSNIIQTLLDNKVILENPECSAKDKSGRKPIKLTINKEFGCIMGIELQTDSYNVCICNFDGSILLKNTGSVAKNDNLTDEENFTHILQCIIENSYSEVIKLKLPLLSICVGMPGIINTDKNTIIYSEPFNLENYAFPKEITKKYNVPVLFENDAKCCSWFVKSKSGSNREQDYLCVLTKNHDTQGISVGLSFTMNGKVINGNNYAAGEYISASWLPSKKTQTGLAQAVLSTINTIEDSYIEFIKDLLKTITTFIPLLEPQTVYLFGQNKENAVLIRNVIKNDVQQFDAILERCNSKLEIYDEEDYFIANGAALMFIQKLLEMPNLNEKNKTALSWDDIFKIQNCGKDL